ESAGREVLDDDVGAGRDRLDRPSALLGDEVEGDRLLVAIDGQVVRRHPAPRLVGRAPAAGDVAVGRMLDLDDPGTQVRKQHRAERAGQDARQVEDQDAVERSRHSYFFTAGETASHPSGPGTK